MPEIFMPMSFNICCKEVCKFPAYLIPGQKAYISVIHGFIIHALLIVYPDSYRVCQGISCRTLIRWYIAALGTSGISHIHHAGGQMNHW